MSTLDLDMPKAITPSQLTRIREIIGRGPVLIITHDNPDPDALASGKAMMRLLETWDIPAQLVYSGLVARAENRAMLTRLTPEWSHRETLADLDRYSAIIMVDTQPGSGNNRLPSDRRAHIVIDHHQPRREALDKVPYVDVRPELGSAATMLYQYLDAAGIAPDAILSTALFYGLKTDTRGLARGASLADEVAYLKLLGSLDHKELVQIEQAGLPREYYRAFSDGLRQTRVYGRAIIARLGQMHRPDFAAEMADLLIRLEGSRAVLCLGEHEDTLHLSLRTKPLVEEAGQLIQQVVMPPGKAGGHRSMAGGQIPLQGQSGDDLIAQIEQRFLRIVGEGGEGVALLDE
jgi:nanoRNase/pAp phosphatase (c-di-AMP/oligoRNAs hydrolase)